MTEREPESWLEQFHRLRKAAETGCCGICNRTLAPHEPVWRRRFTRRSMLGWGTIMVPCCEQHNGVGGVFADYQKPSPCEGCGRTVHTEWSRRLCRRTFCCEVCEVKARCGEARDKRRQARGATRVCEQCGETFELTRSDARYCSGPCKQVAYRLRVTDSKRLRVSTFDTRNAV
jgi:hypothetical protein